MTILTKFRENYRNKKLKWWDEGDEGDEAIIKRKERFKKSWLEWIKADERFWGWFVVEWDERVSLFFQIWVFALGKGENGEGNKGEMRMRKYEEGG